MPDMCDGMTTEERIWTGCLSSVTFAIIVTILFVICALSSCKTTRTVTVTVPVSHTDTLIITKAQRDSIYLRDSTHVSEQQHGDTILLKITKWHTEYRDREVHDTLYQAKVDSVPIPYPVPEYIKKPLTWWQKTQMYAGDLLLAAICIIGMLWVIRIKTKLL